MQTFPVEEISRMRDSVFFEGPDSHKRYTRFWTLLILSSIIASAGVVGDSTATVIGAMIVAPLMTPIQGTMLSVVLAARTNLFRSVTLVITGAASAVVVGWLFGLLVLNPVTAEVNSQVAGRVHPRLVDLLAATATGVVGSVALVRKDISDTLPGVAIAISLVPPLCVAGLTLESGAYHEAAGALLLFLTNVAAILGTGIVVMAIYGVQRAVKGASAGQRDEINRRAATTVVAAIVVLILVPLTLSTYSVIRDTTRERNVRNAATEWAAGVGWEVTNVETNDNDVVVEFEGAFPVPDSAGLRAALIARRVDPAGVRAQFLPRATVDLGAPG
jgi:uncharacterized hydrophobic protein (TIGR00271 family)